MNFEGASVVVTVRPILERILDAKKTFCVLTGQTAINRAPPQSESVTPGG